MPSVPECSDPNFKYTVTEPSIFWTSNDLRFELAASANALDVDVVDDVRVTTALFIELAALHASENNTLSAITKYFI
jgi:hypothetical protein